LPQLKRLQLGEIHDQPWCPGVLRNAVTDFLQYSANHWGQYTPLLPTLCYFLQRVEARRIVDLCSGASGPWQQMYRTVGRAFGASFHIVLTDRYPNLAAFHLARELSGGVVDFREESVDASELPVELSGFRTLFGSFHHFSPLKAREVLQNAVDSGEGIGIFEMTDRRAASLLAMLTVPFFVLCHGYKVRPFRWSRLFFTYLLPVLPILIMVDGIISCLRSYTTEELAQLTASLTGAPYDWEIRQLGSPRSPFPIIYAIGCPGLAAKGRAGHREPPSSQTATDDLQVTSN
jgi:hypothetical protein